jgi:PKD repeat protein
MKSITTIVLVVFCCTFCFFSSSIFAQDLKPCGTTEMHLKMMESDPVYKQNYLSEQERLKTLDKEAYANGYKDARLTAPLGPPKYIIPVVFHIIHQYGIENISDEQARDAIRTLNEDFRKRNKDTVNTIDLFKPIAADCEIEFRLAQLDPNGNPTNGIERIASPYTSLGNDSSKLNPWPRSKYLNIWVTKYIKGGFAAYANYPGTATDKDGIISLHTYIGAIGTGSLLGSHTLSHEVAHWLNIQHVWGNTNAPEVNCGDDDVLDTPVTKGHNNKCPLNEQFCNAGIVENVQNFMEYSYCFTMFTNGQKTRMHNALNNTAGDRNNVWTTANLIATGVTTPPQLIKADFRSLNMDNVVCQGATLKFIDQSWNGSRTSWNWTFEGGNPATSTDSMPVVTYANPGVYDVQLTVSNSTTTVSTTKKKYVTVNPTIGAGEPYYSESFETDTLPNAKWTVRYNGPGNAWKQTNLAAVHGTHSAMVLNTPEALGYANDLIGPSIDMTKVTGPNLVLNFKVAYAKRTPASNDKLQVLISADCGRTWDLRKSISATTLSNGIIQAGNFIPTAQQWTEQTIPLSSYSSVKNLFYKFAFVSNNGNNIYLDDINVTGSVGVAEEWISKLNLNVYPNPSKENAVVSFDLEEKEQIAITVQDIVGRHVSIVFSGNLGAGHHQYMVSDHSKLSAGIYFINFTVGKQSLSRKLIINE